MLAQINIHVPVRSLPYGQPPDQGQSEVVIQAVVGLETGKMGMNIVHAIERASIGRLGGVAINHLERNRAGGADIRFQLALRAIGGGRHILEVRDVPVRTAEFQSDLGLAVFHSLTKAVAQFPKPARRGGVIKTHLAVVIQADGPADIAANGILDGRFHRLHQGQHITRFGLRLKPAGIQNQFVFPGNNIGVGLRLQGQRTQHRDQQSSHETSLSGFWGGKTLQTLEGGRDTLMTRSQ